MKILDSGNLNHAYYGLGGLEMKILDGRGVLIVEAVAEKTADERRLADLG